MRTKRVLYFGGLHRQFDRLFKQMINADGAARVAGDSRSSITYEDLRFDWIPTFSPESALEILERHFVNLLILDLRWGGAGYRQRIEQGMQLLRALDHADDIELRYGFHRILVLTSGPDADEMDQLAVRLGSAGVRHVLRDYNKTEEGDPDFGPRLLRKARRVAAERTVGQTALCASGGGVTGIYFELGVLKCLSDVLRKKSINEFDLYFGISAGAVVTSLLSVGYSVEEIMASLAGLDAGRIPPMSLNIFRFTHLDTKDISMRAAAAVKMTAKGLKRMVHGDRPGIDQVFMDYTGLVGPPFHARTFEKLLNELLSAAGSNDDFNRLARPLYIGASDQDARSHVLFGDQGYTDVPISTAVSASLSINPAFGAVPINGRYYEDGAITRTSDFVEAVERGSDLAFVIDPFVPYVSDQPGLSHRHGMLYNIDQDMRTISYTRFEATRDAILRSNPEIRSYTFLPSNRQRKLLSKNPMDHRPYLEIWKAAYLSTLRRIERVEHRLAGDLAPRGFELNLDEAQAIADQLRSAKHLEFRDFFLDGRLRIPTPPFLS